jgi:hypothetical protein
MPSGVDQRFRVQGFWRSQIVAGFIRIIGLIGLIRSIGSVYTNQYNQ